MDDDVIPQLLPDDKYNRTLESNVHPRNWKNPTASRPYHLVVIGAGTAGLVTAAGAAGLGARVALIERELMGGDCLNVGCVPSKGMIGAARVAASVGNAAPFGVNVPNGTAVDFGKVMQRMRSKRAQISPADSAMRFSELGVDVFFGTASFLDQKTVSITQRDGSSETVKFKKAVIATGARAAAPPIKGLDSIRYLTNETLFSLTELPKRFAVIGSGPIGCEMAQTFARLGSQVVLYERGNRILPREESDASAVLQKQLIDDGVQLILNAKEMVLAPATDGRICVQVSQNQAPVELVFDDLLVAVGRAPNVAGLNLEKIDVRFDQSGVEVNDYLQTTNPRIFAAGDICSKYQFTHAADFQARIVIQNALFSFGPFGKKKVSKLVIPWATYTSPEIAHVGMYPDDAAQAGVQIDTYSQQLDEIDRAILEGKEEGFIRIHTKKGTDKILGATIVAENAGDLISEISVAMTNGLGLAKIGASIHPYPTQAEAIRKLGDQFNRKKLTPFAKKILGVLLRINVGR